MVRNMGWKWGHVAMWPRSVKGSARSTDDFPCKAGVVEADAGAAVTVSVTPPAPLPLLRLL